MNKMPPTTVDVEKLKIKTVETGNPPMGVGIHFFCPAEQSRVEFIKTWAKDVEKAMGAFDLPGFDPSVLLIVSLDAVFGCGGQATYRTAEEVPLVNVPCPCGDPNHWLIKWQDCRMNCCGQSQSQEMKNDSRRNDPALWMFWRFSRLEHHGPRCREHDGNAPSARRLVYMRRSSMGSEIPACPGRRKSTPRPDRKLKESRTELHAYTKETS